MPKQEQWQLTGSGPESYERYQVPSVFEPLAHIFLDHVRLERGQHVLDVACGTGVVARLAAETIGSGGRIVGVDLNPGMLEIARQNAPTGSADIDWRHGDAAELPVNDAGFDTVLCQQGLQFFPNKPAALGEMYRALVPGGRLALCVWRSIEHSPCNSAAVEALARLVSQDVATRSAAPYSFGDPERLHAHIRGAGFRNIEIREAVVTRRMLPPEISIPGCLQSMPIAPEIAALDEATHAALVEEISDALEGYRDADGLSIPQGTHIALAVK